MFAGISQRSSEFNINAINRPSSETGRFRDCCETSSPDRFTGEHINICHQITYNEEEFRTVEVAYCLAMAEVWVRFPLDADLRTGCSDSHHGLCGNLFNPFAVVFVLVRAGDC